MNKLGNRSIGFGLNYSTKLNWTEFVCVFSAWGYSRLCYPVRVCFWLCILDKCHFFFINVFFVFFCLFNPVLLSDISNEQPEYAQ